MIDYLITSFILFVIGVVFNLYHARKTYGKYGYRSKLATSTPERWQLAQKLSRQYFLVAGLIGMALAYFVYKTYPGQTSRFFSAVVPILVLFGLINRIEKRLKREGPST